MCEYREKTEYVRLALRLSTFCAIVKLTASKNFECKIFILKSNQVKCESFKNILYYTFIPWGQGPVFGGDPLDYHMHEVAPQIFPWTQYSGPCGSWALSIHLISATLLEVPPAPQSHHLPIWAHPPVPHHLLFSIFHPGCCQIRFSTELAPNLGIILEFSLHIPRTLGPWQVSQGSTQLSYHRKRIGLVQAIPIFSPEHSSQARSYLRPLACPSQVQSSVLDQLCSQGGLADVIGPYPATHDRLSSVL